MASITMISMEALAEIVSGRKAFVRTHSGEVRPGDVFVALPKAVPVAPSGPDYSVAAQYLAAAVKAGASYAVCPQFVYDAARAVISETIVTQNLAICIAEDTRMALGLLARAWYGTEKSGVRLVGITGTNGKTTSTYLLEQIFKAAGHSSGVIGTVEYRWPGYEEASPLTTPDCMRLHGMVAAMAGAGADTAFMEVSSHAIEQNRIAGLDFTAALFTNLTQDHLDYHKNMEDYYGVKKRLFLDPANGGTQLEGKNLAVNVDDPYGERLFAGCPSALGYGFGSSARKYAMRCLMGELLEQSQDGLRLAMQYKGNTWELRSPLVGAFNASNLLGAQALALACGIAQEHMQSLALFGGVPGRLERIVNPHGFAVFVDYAHTPDALRKALQALREAHFRRVITVFGCGGNRDRTKRPLMGQAAAELSDIVVVTSDNPRHEEPLAIMADIKPGLAAAHKVIEEVDRKKAIGLALDALGEGDALLVAGKGHEPYQIIGDTKYPFSDQQIVRALLGCA